METETICAKEPPADIPLSFKSALTLIAFIFQIICTVYPLHFRIPVISKYLRSKVFKRDSFTVTLDMLWGSLLCIIFLLATTTIGINELKAGIVGDEVIQPYAIIIIFFTLAYASISLDYTGLFKAISIWAAKKSKSSKKILFNVFYGISSCLTLFTSNDIVILTLTPIITYYTQRININAVPYLMAQFIAANTWSVTLLVGNPTNIIVATAENMKFATYTKVLGIPAIAAGLVSYSMLFIYYRRSLSGESLQPETAGIQRSESSQELTAAPPPETDKIDIEDEQEDDDSLTIPSKRSAIIGSVIFILGLVFLVMASFMNTTLWIATVSVCAAMLIKDITYDLIPQIWNIKTSSIHQNTEMTEVNAKNGRQLEGSGHGEIDRSSPLGDSVVTPTVQQPIKQSIVYDILSKMPWKIVPCIFSMFILVAAMDSTGWISRIAIVLKNVVSNSGPIATAISMTYISSILCALVNNQPMTILLTRVLFHANFRCFVSESERISSLFGLIMGSNFGANLTLNGALAGIMWESILKSKGLNSIGYFYFMKVGGIVMFPTILIAAVITGAELGAGWYS